MTPAFRSSHLVSIPVFTTSLKHHIEGRLRCATELRKPTPVNYGFFQAFLTRLCAQCGSPSCASEVGTQTMVEAE